MIDRVDLLIAVIGVVVSVLGSSTAMWAALARKADRDDLARLEARLEAKLDALSAKLDRTAHREAWPASRPSSTR